MAARNAAVLGRDRVAVIEFGVAGGNGLLELERAAEAATEITGLPVEVYGFDSGTGMPAPADHRDVPWLINEGLFPMDEPALRARLTTAELILGTVRETVPSFCARDHAPVGFVAFDLDYYSSTREALALVQEPPGRLLPRIVAYFDDVFGYGWSDFAGERAAIDDFNAANGSRKIGKIHGLRYSLPASEHAHPWHEQMYLIHVFDHPEYCRPEGVFDGPAGDGFSAAHRLAPDS